MVVYLVGDPKRVVWSKRPAMLFGSERRKHNAFDLIDEIFENLNSISNIFQELHDFFFLQTQRLFIFLQEAARLNCSVKNNDGCFPIRGTSILNITEMGFDILIKHFWGLFFGFFTAGKASCINNKQLI